MEWARNVIINEARILIESSCCERVLGALVAMGELSTDGKAFSSPREGRRSA
jgi:hypothetical protein